MLPSKLKLYRKHRNVFDVTLTVNFRYQSQSDVTENITVRTKKKCIHVLPIIPHQLLPRFIYHCQTLWKLDNWILLFITSFVQDTNKLIYC